jgi:putative ABC transport system permease protein
VTPGPPRVAARLLAHRVPPEWREFVLGDLEEEFHVRAAQSVAAARRWYWLQTLRCLARPPRAHPPKPVSRGDARVLTILSDLLLALRVLRRAPSFALAVVAVLALGIGANTALFSIVNAVLLRPLPFPDSDRLVRLFHVPPQTAFPGIKLFSVSPANFYDWQRQAHSFERMAIYHGNRFTLTGAGEPESLLATSVGDGFFEIVGGSAELGRVFAPEEDAPARGHVVIVSDGFWKSHLGGSPDAIGRTLILDGESYTIVGVMPASFTNASWGATAQPLWVPNAFTPEERAVRGNHNDQVIARLKPGVDLEQANAELDAISKRLEAAYPNEDAGWGATAIQLRELIVGQIRLPLLILLAAVGLVLLIACANVGNLLFVRALSRRKEIAIRAALGAGRGRVFQQLLVESLLLAVTGGVAGVFLARGSLHAAASLLANQLPRADEIMIDGRVLVFAAVISIVTGMIAGTMPALRAGRTDLAEALKEGGRANGAVGVRTRRLLIVCEVALSLVLLAGAGLMGRTLVALNRVDAGFDPHNVLTLRVALPRTKYDTTAKMLAFTDAALERIRALPGVEAAGAIDSLPLQGGSVQPIVLEGRSELLPRDQPTVNVRKISPGYLRAMKIPVLRGRDVADSDTEALLVSRSAAKMLWGDADPIGRRVTLPLEAKGVAREVVGITGDVRLGSLTDGTPPAAVYEFTRHEFERPTFSVAFAIRTTVPPLTLAKPATAVVHAIDPNQPVQQVTTMDEIVDQTLAPQEFSAMLLGVFAAAALVLASVGIYSVLSYIVRGRRREIGIRAALGADTGDVLRLVIAEGLLPTSIGVGIGIAGALAAGRLMQNVVYGVSAWDPITIAGVSVVLLAVAMLASAVPAWRASRVDPVIVLRD